MSEKVNYGILKDYDDNKFIPIGHSKLVYDDDGNSVEDRLIALEDEMDDIQAQDGFKNVKVGEAIVVADQAEDTLELAGNKGITLTADTANDKVTISHSNQVTAKTSYSQNSDASASGNSFTVTEVKYDTEGHITGKQEKTITLPSDISGNAATATRLETPVNITITDSNGNDGNTTSLIGNTDIKLDLPDTITANIEGKDGEYFFIDKENKVVAKISESGIEATNVTSSKTSLNDLKEAFDEFANDVITEVVAGTGLTGGGSNGSVTLNVATDRGLSVQNDKVGHSTTGGTDVTQAAGKAVTKLDIDAYGHVTGTGVSDVINSITVSGNGNAITAASNANGAVTFTKGATFKTQQTAVKDPTASGNATAFIDSISQDANGVITVTKKNITAATQSAAGTMSADDKKKLDGIASGAEVNQNAFSNVKIGSITVAADSKTDTLEIAAGTGITLAGDATNDKVTITNAGVRAVSTGTKRGTVSVNTNGTAADIAVNGLGFEDDGSYHFIDNNSKVIAKIDNAGVHATDFIIDGADTSLSGVKTQYTTLKSQLDNTKYAASTSVGGSAISANKLNTDAGSSTNPVYFENGIPKATGDSLAKDITGNAASANKVNNKLTIAGKEYDGSAAVTVSIADLGVTGAMVYLGTSTTAVTDGGTEKPTIGGTAIATTNLQKGNVVLYGSQEFVWTGSKWELLGDEGSYALKTVSITAGDGLTGGGTLAADRTISHAATSKLTGEQSAGTGKALTSVTVDTFGHVTAIGSGNVVTSITAGDGLTGSATSGAVELDVNVDRGLSIVNDKVGHSYTAGTDTTSTANPDYGKTFTVVDSVSKDTYGHVTKVNTKTVTMPSAQTSITGNAGTADKWKTGRSFSITDNAGHTGTATTVDGSANVSLDLPDTIAADLVGNITTTDDHYAFIDTKNNTLAIIQNGGIKTIDVFDKNNNALSTAVQTVKSSDVTSTSTVAGVNVGDSRSGNDVTISGTVAAATTTTAGVMTAADKQKLDGITASADAVSYTPTLINGTKIGAITINGTSKNIYTPTLGGKREATADTSVISGVTTSDHAIAATTKNISGSKGIITSGTLDTITVSHNTIGGTDVTQTAGKAVTKLDIDDYGHVTGTGTSSVINSVTTSGSGNAFTSASVSDGVLTLTKGATYNNYALPLAADGTRGGIQIGYTQSEQNYPVALSSEKAYVNVPWTDTKVTAVENHYTPSTDSNAALNVDASSTTAATWGSTDLVTGVNIQRDAKGHVTGLTLDSIQMPANPDTGATSITTSGTGNAVTSASYDSSTRKITLTKGSTFKTQQTEIKANATGNGITFIDTIGQNTNGVISTTTKTIRTASNSQTGVVKLSDSISSTSSVSGGVAATPQAVKTVQDNVNAVSTATNNRIHTILPGTKNGSIKYAKYTGDNKTEEWTDNVFVQGIGDSGDGNLYFVDNDSNSNTYITNDGIHSVDFTVDGTCSLKGLHSSFTTVESDYISGVRIGNNLSNGLSLTVTPDATSHSVTLNGTVNKANSSTAGTVVLDDAPYLFNTNNAPTAATGTAATPRAVSMAVAAAEGMVNGVYTQLDKGNIVAGTGLSGGGNPTRSSVTLDLEAAKVDELGGIKISSKNNSVITVNSESNTSGRYYPIELTNNDLAVVNVPWANTTYSFSTGDGDGQIKITPSSGSAYNVTIKGLGNTADSNSGYLKLSGGTMSGHIYLGGSVADSSTSNTSQLIFGTPETEHVAISSNDNAIIINRAADDTERQIQLQLDIPSVFPSGMNIGQNNNVENSGITIGGSFVPPGLTIGIGNTVGDRGSLVHGYGNETSGTYIDPYLETTDSSIRNFISGSNNKISGYDNQVLGNSHNIINSTNVFTAGANNEIRNAYHAIALGRGLLIANDDVAAEDIVYNRTVIGNYNANDPDAVFIVANGSGVDSNRKNAFTIKNNGSAVLAEALTIGSTAIDSNNFLTIGNNAFVVKKDGSATLPGTMSIGCLNCTQISSDYIIPAADNRFDIFTNTSKTGTATLYVDNKKVPTMSTQTITIPADTDLKTEFSVTCTGVTSSNTVIVSPSPSSLSDYSNCGIYCSGQGTNQLKFLGEGTPTIPITVQVIILN